MLSGRTLMQHIRASLAHTDGGSSRPAVFDGEVFKDRGQIAGPAVRTLALLSRLMYINGLAEYSTAQSSVTLAMLMPQGTQPISPLDLCMPCSNSGDPVPALSGWCHSCRQASVGSFL